MGETSSIMERGIPTLWKKSKSTIFRTSQTPDEPAENAKIQNLDQTIKILTRQRSEVHQFPVNTRKGNSFHHFGGETKR